MAGKSVTGRQLAKAEGVCNRSPVVTETLTEYFGRRDIAQCDEITGDHLAQIGALKLQDKGISSLKTGDFEGLSGLHTLRLEGNQLNTLPEGVFNGLSNLRELNLGDNLLTEAPKSVFEVLTSLENLGLDGNRLAEVPAGLFAGFPNLFLLSLSRNPFTELPGGVFDGLSKLRYLYLDSTGMTQLPAELFQGLTSLEALYMSNNRFTGLPAGLFQGLSNLIRLRFSSSELTDLPVGLFAGLSRLETLTLGFRGYTVPVKIFDGLSRLKTLEMGSYHIEELPVGIFDGLSNLEWLLLGNNRLSDLPAGIFSNLSRLIHLELSTNQLATVRADMFQGLSTLNRLDLRSNDLSDLPYGVFSGLTSLKTLFFGKNEFRRLPDGVFIGLKRLGEVGVERNLVDPLPLPISLEKVGQNQFKAIAPSGAPFTLAVPITVSAGGLIEGESNAVTIPAGAAGSDLLQVKRELNTQEAISVDIGTLPNVPDGHLGYALAKDETLPLVVLSSSLATDAALIDLSLSHGVLHPVFATDTTSYTALVSNEVSSLTVSSTTRNESASVGLFDESDQELTDTDAVTEDHQINLRIGENAIQVRVTAEDGTSTQSYSLVVTRDGKANVCGRSEQAQAAIISAVAGIDKCNDVTVAHLAAITVLDSNKRISSLRAGDFVGLSALRQLSLYNNQLLDLPSGIFSGLTALKSLDLAINRVSSLPADVFSGLTALEFLNLNNNRLTTLPDGAFSSLTALEELHISANRLSDLPQGIFSGLDALEVLSLYSNRFKRLPKGLFAGLPTLDQLNLNNNIVSPLPLPVSLEKVGDTQFKALAASGVPFEVEISISVSAAGVINGGARALTIPAGAVESSPVVVTRVSGTEAAVTVDIASLSALPDNHNGYFLRKDKSLPRVILPGPQDSPPAQVTGVEVTPGVEEIAVSWSGVADASGYKVQWRTGDETYDESRQAMIDGGAAISHTIVGLTPGAEYRVRVIATKENADDGTPSAEVTGVPEALSLEQVIGVEAESGSEQLDVSWTAVSGANGYKVQWKSGTEGYDEDRQVALTHGNTVRYTIIGLLAGVEYTVRVIATSERAEDGPPSSEVVGTPKAQRPGQVSGLEVEPGFEQLVVSWSAVSDADGYKVEWKSGSEDYADSRQAIVGGGETTTHTITDLTADTEYTIRVIATRDNADDGLPSDEVTAMPTAADPDVNGDGVLDGDDALIMYYSFVSAAQLGDGETGGTPESRQSLLAGYSGKTNPSDGELKEMIRKVYAWQDVGVGAGGDMNEDGAVDDQDALVMYYAYTAANLVGDGTAGGTERFRRLLLAPFANQANPTDEDLKAMLRRANKLKEDFA